MLKGQKKGEKWRDPRLGRIDDEYLAQCLENARLNEEVAAGLEEMFGEDGDGDQG